MAQEVMAKWYVCPFYSEEYILHQNANAFSLAATPNNIGLRSCIIVFTWIYCLWFSHRHPSRDNKAVIPSNTAKR